ncbi:MAG: YraN family protein [Clostridiales bacterium]|nr:YraN family protein [Clostridiales bacterium]
MTTKEIGDFGEKAACRYLKRRGMEIVERNFRTRSGEIDIIAKDGSATVFVEVKTRRTKDFGNPGEFVDYRKQEKIMKTAVYYLGRDDVEMRFDVIEVLYRVRLGKPWVSEINHIENAF